MAGRGGCGGGLGSAEVAVVCGGGSCAEMVCDLIWRDIRSLWLNIMNFSERPSQMMRNDEFGRLAGWVVRHSQDLGTKKEE